MKLSASIRQGLYWQKNFLTRETLQPALAVFSIENSVPNICSDVSNSPAGGAGRGILSCLSALVPGKEERCRVRFYSWSIVSNIEHKHPIRVGNPPLHTIAMTDMISRQTSHCDTHSRSSFARRHLTVDLILYGPNPFQESSQPTFSFYVENKDGARIFHAQVRGRL